MRSPEHVTHVEGVTYASDLPGRGGSHYARIVTADGRVWHYGPWLTRWAADKCAEVLLERYAFAGTLMARMHDYGDGDTCPLSPEHGNMYVLKDTDPALQWCPHREHAGSPGKAGPPATRSRWPLYGLEASVAAYMARLGRTLPAACRLPDLTDLEVD